MCVRPTIANLISFYLWSFLDHFENVLKYKRCYSKRHDHPCALLAKHTCWNSVSITVLCYAFQISLRDSMTLGENILWSSLCPLPLDYSWLAVTSHWSKLSIMMFIVEHTVESMAWGGRVDAAEEAHLAPPPLPLFLASFFLQANLVAGLCDTCHRAK